MRKLTRPSQPPWMSLRMLAEEPRTPWLLQKPWCNGKYSGSGGCSPNVEMSRHKVRDKDGKRGLEEDSGSGRKTLGEIGRDRENHDQQRFWAARRRKIFCQMRRVHRRSTSRWTEQIRHTYLRWAALSQSAVASTAPMPNYHIIVTCASSQPHVSLGSG